jgi:pimeloyl-ACP methyl ester carboxylesterase
MNWTKISTLGWLAAGCSIPCGLAAASDPKSDQAVAAKPLRHELSPQQDRTYWQRGSAHLSYQEAGDRQRPTVILLHAAGHGSGDYAATFEALRSSYRVVTLDWPGQGRSDDDGTEPTVTAYAQLLVSFIAHLGSGSVHLVGNSIGGGAALLTAMEQPALVASVAVANPAGLDEGGWIGSLYTRWMARKFESATEDPQGFGDWFERYYQQVLPSDQARTQRDRIVAARAEIAPVVGRAWRGFLRPENDLRARLGQLRVPVLVTWARRDTVVRWSRNRAAVESIPQHQLHVFDAGHTPSLETPQAFLETLQAFLSAVDGQRR